MKKIDLLLGAAMLLGATGCAKNEAVGVGGVTVERAEVVITAETATTKTVYDEDTTTTKSAYICAAISEPDIRRPSRTCATTMPAQTIRAFRGSHRLRRST